MLWTIFSYFFLKENHFFIFFVRVIYTLPNLISFSFEFFLRSFNQMKKNWLHHQFHSIRCKRTKIHSILYELKRENHSFSYYISLSYIRCFSYAQRRSVPVYMCMLKLCDMYSHHCSIERAVGSRLPPFFFLHSLFVNTQCCALYTYASVCRQVRHVEQRRLCIIHTTALLYAYNFPSHWSIQSCLLRIMRMIFSIDFCNKILRTFFHIRNFLGF